MLPDFRFALGALLAIALIAVAGLGLVTSVRLAREARIGPLDDSRSLAYAGHAEWNQFYDPDGARRFQGLAGKTGAPLAEPPSPIPAEALAVEPPAAAPAPAAPEERTASIPTDRREPTDRQDRETTAVAAPVLPDKAPETEPPRADPEPEPEKAPALTAALPAEPAGAPAPVAPIPDASAPDAPSAPVSSASPAPAPAVSAPSTPTPDEPPAERLATAPATVPEPGRAEEARAPAAASIQPQADPPPTPRARPKLHFHKKVVRVHIHHHPVRQQSVQNPSIPASNAPWPGYANQFTGAAKKNAGSLASRPQ